MEENRKGTGVFYAVVGVATLVVAIIGATFAYFSASATNDTDVKGITASGASLAVAVTKVSDEATSKNMIPMLSTDLQKGTGYYAGDLSGITQKKAPFWFQPFYKPGKKIARQKDWNKKLEEIVDKAIADNPKAVADYPKSMGFLIGQVMKASKGKANPGLVNKMIKEKLG